MALNAAQYLAPLNSQQVLTGYAQGIIAGTGFIINPDGTIELDSSAAATRGFLTSSNLVTPILNWSLTPGTADSLLINDGSGNLSWSTGYIPVAPENQAFPHTGAAVLPSGITANRPAGAERGYIRYNTDAEQLEWYNGTDWFPVSPPTGSIYSFVSTLTPTALQVGDLWLDQNYGQEKVWDGSTWASTSPIATTTAVGQVQVGTNIQVDPAGVISVEETVGVPGAVSSIGLTAIVDNVGSASDSYALSANQGRLLQAQIDALEEASNLTFAGTLNGAGILQRVTTVAAAEGFVIGDPLPPAAAGNANFFVICEQAGSFTPPGGNIIAVTAGDWLISTGSAWELLDVGYDPTPATTTQAGIVELATGAETQAGTDSSRAVTPAGLNSRVASETLTGLAELATQTETNLGTDDERIVTPLKLASRTATEIRTGIAEIATQAETDAGTDDERFLTPLKLANRVASEGLTGIAEIATQAETDAGTDNARIVTPLKLASRVASETLTGIAEIATQAEVDAGTDDARFITPLKLSGRAATETLTGIAEIATQAEVDAGTDDTRFVTPLKLSSFISAGQINATDVPVSPAINGNTTVQATLADAIYSVSSSNASVTTFETPVGQVNLVVSQATETLRAGAEIATQAETETGADDARMVTPLKLRTAAVYKSDFNGKGDILSASADDAPAILASGSSGQFLTVNPSTATGLAWYTIPPTIGVATDVSNFGITTITDNVTSTSINSALSANQGKLLQDQIDALVIANNLTLAGVINGSGILTYATPEGILESFTAGNPLPTPVATNAEYFVICEGAGSFTPPGGVVTTVTQGDWVLSTGTAWQLLDIGYNAPTASTTQAGIVELATDAETQAGTDATRAVTPAGLRSAAVYKSDFNAKGDLLSASANDTPTILGVGANGRVLTADSTTTSGITWKVPQIAAIDDISSTFDGVTKAFTLKIATVAYSPVPSTNIAVHLGGVIQIPGAGNAYTVSGSTITFEDAPPASTTFYAFTVAAI